MAFADRRDAGRRLAARLTHYAQRADVLVLGLPRGGVPVAYEVAQALSAPLDVFVVRKLGVPGHEELAMGAIATGGVRVLNLDVVEELSIPSQVIEKVTEAERQELERRERLYRDDRPPPVVEGRIIIVVDDGLATGATMRAAVAALRQSRPAWLVVAIPTSARSTYEELGREVDEIVAVILPDAFHAVGLWYHDFRPTTDDEVRQLLNAPPDGLQYRTV